MFEHHRITYSPYVLGSFIIPSGIISDTEYQRIYDRAMNAFVDSSFMAMSYYLTITGENPG